MYSFLHMRSIFFTISCIGLVLFLCMFYISCTRKVYPGFNCWTVASFLYFIGNILIGLRDVVAPFFSIIIANTFLICTFMLIPYGISLFAEKKPSIWSYLGTLLFVMASFSYFTYASPSIPIRIIIISLTGLVFSMLAVAIFRKNVLPMIEGSNILLQLSLSALAFWCGVRMLYTFLLEKKIDHFLLSSSFQSISIIILSGCFVAACFSFFIINFQKLRVDHSTTTAELSMLKGLIPICSHCKKIRNSKGYWDKLETYLTSHSNAEFSHSICTDCLERLYPEESESEHSSA